MRRFQPDNGSVLPASGDASPITHIALTFDDNKLASALFGQYGQNLALLERKLGVVADSRGNQVTIEGPRDACTNPISGITVPICSKDSLGGELFWATTAEVRFPFPYVPDSLGMQGAIFVDAGSLWQPSGLALDAVANEGSFILDSTQVRLSTGFSLIWQSPLGPLRADFAEALLKEDFDETEFFRFGASTNF